MKQSLLQNKNGILMMMASSLLACAGQLLWKLSVDHGMWVMMAGLCLYGVGALFMLIAYRYGSLSVLHPVMSLSYVFSLIFGAWFLGEPIGAFKIIGVAVIMTGVVLIGGGDRA